MRIRLNGEHRELPESISVARLLDDLELDRDRVAVELNRRILSRAEHDAVKLSDNDEMEIVTFVGGG
ncbi:MAG TPA: sulfur carrier protein ThiS [Vicinamibacteria bacterium]|nr:sulfur carrier protein ThiS [Vicinamibacteria bacterium]